MYVIIVLFTGLFVTAGCSWGVVCLIQKPFRRPRKRQRYSLLDDGEDSIMRGKFKALIQFRLKFFIRIMKLLYFVLISFKQECHGVGIGIGFRCAVQCSRQEQSRFKERKKASKRICKIREKD